MFSTVYNLFCAQRLKLVLAVFLVSLVSACAQPSSDGRVPVSSINFNAIPEASLAQDETFGWSCTRSARGLKVDQLNGYDLIYIGPVGRDKGGIQERNEIRSDSLPCDFFFVNVRSPERIALEHKDFHLMVASVFLSQSQNAHIVRAKILELEAKCDAQMPGSEGPVSCGEIAYSRTRESGVGDAFTTFIREDIYSEILIWNDEVFINGEKFNAPSL